jgi:hypothetical protein
MTVASVSIYIVLLLISVLSFVESFAPSFVRLAPNIRRGIRPSTTTTSTSTTTTTTSFQTTLQAEKSVAQEWADEQKKEYLQDKTRPRKYLVIGGGWAGWGAAKTLCESCSTAGIESDVILMDALYDPTGQSPYLSQSGKPVEAGTRGFWKDYPNINALCEQLNIREEDVFTPFTNSSFYSPDGLEATAPVFSEMKLKDLVGVGENFLSSWMMDKNQVLPQLPSPLGQVLATFPLFERIPLVDRASMVGLLVATIDCLGSDDESVREQYDRMTAHELFIRFQLSKRLVDDFIRPTLLVGLFKPPEELSALVVMELLYYYALAHQDSFDVRWIKNGTVADSLILPLSQMLEKDYGLTVLGGCRVGEISLEKSYNDKLSVQTLKYTRDGKEYEIGNIDGVVLALGCKGMQSVVNASPDLARLPVFSKAASLKGIDVISTRIWFDRVVPTRTPANVFSRFEQLRGSGGTFFMLDQLQEGNLDALWGENNDDQQQDQEPQSRGSVVAADFYNAGALMSMRDEDIIKILTDELLPSAVPKFKGEICM